MANLPEDFLLTCGSFRCISFNFQVFGDFPFIILLFTSSFIILLSENILFILLIGSVFCVALSPNIYKNSKICRKKENIEINNYKNIPNIEEIVLIENCDKAIIFIKVNEIINEENINTIINFMEPIWHKVYDSIVGIEQVNLMLEMYFSEKNLLKYLDTSSIVCCFGVCTSSISSISLSSVKVQTAVAFSSSAA